MNPYLERIKKRGIGHAGRESEKRTIKDLGARAHPASGAMKGAKSDASMLEENFRLEMKSTTTKVIKLEADWLVKISQEAVRNGQKPAIILSFVDKDGKNIMLQNAQWVCMPMTVFRELVQSIANE